jgi:hypothetical protein
MFRSARNTLFASLVATTLFLGACGGDDNGSPTNPTPEPSGSTSFRMVNGSTISAWYIYVRSCGASSWGIDRLGSEVLSPGESATLHLSGGCYDVHAVAGPEDGKEAYWMGQAMSGDLTTLTISNTDWAALAQ